MSTSTTVRAVDGIARVLSVLALLWMSPVAVAEDEGPTRAELLAEGGVSYNRYCESCHGAAGIGDGQVAQYLKIPPADLTMISARREGAFPTEEIHQIIDGRKGVRGHGHDMPIWGDAFQRTEDTEDDTVVERKIDGLVTDLEALQNTSAAD